MSTISNHLATYPGRNTALIIANLSELYLYAIKGFANFVKTGFTWLILLVFSPLLIVAFLGVALVAFLVLRKVKSTLKVVKAETDFLEEKLKVFRSELLQGKRLSVFDSTFDHQTYKLIKKRQEQGNEIERKFGELYKIKPDGEPPVFVRPLVDFVQAFKTYNQKQSELIEFLDRENPHGEWFENLSEKELWDNRNKAYEYLI